MSDIHRVDLSQVHVTTDLDQWTREISVHVEYKGKHAHGTCPNSLGLNYSHYGFENGESQHERVMQLLDEIAPKPPRKASRRYVKQGRKPAGFI